MVFAWRNLAWKKIFSNWSLLLRTLKTLNLDICQTYSWSWDFTLMLYILLCLPWIRASQFTDIPVAIYLLPELVLRLLIAGILYPVIIFVITPKAVIRRLFWPRLSTTNIMSKTIYFEINSIFYRNAVICLLISYENFQNNLLYKKCKSN